MRGQGGKREDRRTKRGPGAEPRDCTAKMAELYREEVWVDGEERTFQGWRIVG